MSENSGIGFAISVKIGIFIENINRRVDRLHPHIESSLMMHNLYESFSLKDNGPRFKQNYKHLLAHIKTEVDGTNKQIKAANKLLSLLKHKKEILQIDYLAIKQVTDERFNEKLGENKSQKLSNENFKLKIDKIITATRKSIFELANYLNEVEKFNQLDKLNKEYKNGVEEAIDIYSFGHLNTSLFVLGRTLEDVLDAGLRKLIKSKKIKKILINKTKYEAKIGILMNANFIDERLFHELNTVRIDRNDTGHPTKRKVTREECENTIQRVILLIEKLQKNLSRIQ